MANIDLDRSLDDIIKQKRPAKGKALGSRSVGGGGRGGRGGQSSVHNSNTHVSKPNNSKFRGNTSGVNRRVGAFVIHKNKSSRINSRLARGGIIKPQPGGSNSSRGISSNSAIERSHSFKSSLAPRVRGPDMSVQRSNNDSNKRRNSIDPKSLVITKAINKRKTRETPSDDSLVIQSKISNQKQQQQQQQQQQQTTYGYQNQPSQHILYSASTYEQLNVQNNNTSINQKNIVLVCNLDPRATAEDVGEACSTFGPILSCDILLDPMGRPLNEAEIEFLYPNSAEECVSKLDNSMADGRLLRARLQSSATLPVVPRYSSRAVVASARVAQGGFDNPQTQQLPMMYQEQYQNNYRSNNPSYSQPHQHQRRY